MISVPNLISVLRLVAAPCVVAAAALQARPWCLSLLAIAVISDAIDGALARAWNQCTPFGARLDSAADFALQFSALVALLLLYPALRTNEIVTATAIGLAYLIPIGVGLWRFGRLTSYHTRLAKIAAFLLAAGAVVWVTTESAWMLRAAAIALVIAGAEELAITFVLPAWQTDVPSIWSAWSGHGSINGSMDRWIDR